MGNYLILTAALAMPLAAGQGREPDCRAARQQGLDWLLKEQNVDGSWGPPMSADRIRRTALALSVLANEDADLMTGPYAHSVKAATLWLLTQCHGGELEGLIALRRVERASPRILSNHALAMCALTQVYGDTVDAESRQVIGAVLKRGINFALKSQAVDGAWAGMIGPGPGLPPSADTTAALMLTLRCCRDAGLPANKDPLKKGSAFLVACTAADGHVKPARNEEGMSPSRDALVLRASGGFMDMPQDPKRARWLAACTKGVALDKLRAKNLDLEAHFWFSQTVWELGDDGWQNQFPDDPPGARLKWSHYRKKVFGVLLSMQLRSGAWSHPRFDQVEATALALAILQQDLRPLPLSR
jgi:hypothetical protein